MHGHIVLLVVVIIIGGLLRVWGIGYDLPFIYHPDEPVYIELSQRIFKTGDLNPHFFNYPSLFFYINALAYVPYYLVGYLLGQFASPTNILSPTVLAMGVVKSPMPTTVLLGRLVTVAFGVASIILMYLAGQSLYGRAVGLLSAAMLAVSPTNVWHNHWVTPDTFVTFFALTTFVASVLILRDGKIGHYALGGICVGLTASSKYNGALVILMVIIAHFLGYGKSGWKSHKLYLTFFLSILAFFMTTPFALLDLSAFVSDLRFEAQHYATGHAGMEGATLRWYLSYIWKTTGVASLFVVLEIVIGGIQDSRKTLLLAIFPIFYFVFINRFVVRNARTLMPLTPFLFMLSISFLMRLIRWLSECSHAIRWQPFLRVGLTALVLAFPAFNTTQIIHSLSQIKSREVARIWIEENLPLGTKIGLESYAPFVDPERFVVEGFVRIIDHPPSWYIDQGFDYVILSEGMYGRYYRDSEIYANEVGLYNEIIDNFTVVQEFTNNGHSILIMLVNHDESNESKIRFRTIEYRSLVYRTYLSMGNEDGG
jgi:4-amino-4-deoxy-L-arabinose transferase-like glycosyltransferase